MGFHGSSSLVMALILVLVAESAFGQASGSAPATSPTATPPSSSPSPASRPPAVSTPSPSPSCAARPPSRSPSPASSPSVFFTPPATAPSPASTPPASSPSPSVSVDDEACAFFRSPASSNRAQRPSIQQSPPSGPSPLSHAPACGQRCRLTGGRNQRQTDQRRLLQSAVVVSPTLSPGVNVVSTTTPLSSASGKRAQQSSIQPSPPSSPSPLSHALARDQHRRPTGDSDHADRRTHAGPHLPRRRSLPSPSLLSSGLSLTARWSPSSPASSSASALTLSSLRFSSASIVPIFPGVGVGFGPCMRLRRQLRLDLVLQPSSSPSQQ